MIDLNAPLGMDRPRRRRRRSPQLLAAAGCAGLAAVAIVGLLAFADPHGGEPYAVAALPLPVDPGPPASIDPTPTASLPPARPSPRPALTKPVDAPRPPAAAEAVAAEATPPGIAGAAYDAGTLENGVKVYRGMPPAAASSKGPLVIDVSRQLGMPPRAAPSKPDALRPDGVRADAPRFDSSRTPAFSPFAPSGSAAPAAPAALGTPAASASPRIALLVGNMGLSQPATREAIEAMPAAVTLAFLPYGGTLPANVAAARAKGHEVLLQVPMENAGAPPPGPHALRAGETPEALAADLDWLLARFQGYAGLSNLLGAPVTADPAAMTALARAAAARGVFIAADGTAARALAVEAASRAGVPAVAGDVLLDATADPAAVRSNLERLVAIARRNGTAVGVASGLPEHMALIARFAAELSGKNIELVPVGTLARRSATVATIAR